MYYNFVKMFPLQSYIVPQCCMCRLQKMENSFVQLNKCQLIKEMPSVIQLVGWLVV